MNDYQARKAARRTAYNAAQGKSQPRRVFRVYARGSLVTLPARFDNLAVGAFASKKEADAFVNPFGPGKNFGSDAMKVVFRMISRDESRTLPPGFDAYVSFNVVSGEV